MLFSFQEMQAFEYCIYQLDPTARIVFKLDDELMTGQLLSIQQTIKLDDREPNDVVYETFMPNLVWWQYIENNSSPQLDENQQVTAYTFNEIAEFIEGREFSGESFPPLLHNVELLASGTRLKFLNVSETAKFEIFSILADQPKG